MDNILRSVGLEDKIPVFKAQQITLELLRMNLGQSPQQRDAREIIKNDTGITTG